MLAKLLNSFRHSAPPNKSLSGSVLKLVHPGGRVECYYMAMSAAKLMDRYPSFFIAKPSVFKQPWDSIVQPDDILLPGQKFFVVPQRAVKKLRRRIQKPNIDLPSEVSSIRSGKASKTKVSAKKCFGIDKSGDDYDQSLDFSSSIQTTKRKGRAKKVVQVAAWHPALESISEM